MYQDPPPALLSRLLHWTMALLILAMLFIGVAMVSSLADYHRLVAIHRPLGLQVLNPVSADDPHSQRLDAVQLSRQHLTGQAVSGDAVTHHSARLRARIADLDVMTQPGQVIRA